jgi:hypothetical protein
MAEIIYGACGVEGCTRCLPLFDEDNNQIPGTDLYCRFCHRLAGADYHLTDAVPPGENNIICDNCWDERLR